MALGVGLFFSIQMRDARGLEGTAEVSKAPPLSHRGHHPCVGNMQLLAQSSFPRLGVGKEQSHPSCKKGEAQRGS